MAVRRKLTDATRAKLIEVLAPIVLDGMFGDGLERDYVLDGVSYVGLRNLDDRDLVDEFKCIADVDGDGGDDGQDAALLAEAELQLAPPARRRRERR